MATRNICLVLEYDGSGYCGWQRQVHEPSIQASLETALTALTGDAPMTLRLRAAGRTDSGVHALGQVVNFHTTDTREARRFAPALNHQLPRDIRVQTATSVAANFDSRYDAQGKHYRYLLAATSQPSALYHKRAWHVRRPLSVDKLRQGAQYFLGEHDFESFRSAHCDAPHARRHIRAIEVEILETVAAGRLIAINYFATAFCRHMCRILTGTLVEVATGKRDPHALPAVLAARDRAQAGVTAVPEGLYLVKVCYPAA